MGPSKDVGQWKFSQKPKFHFFFVAFLVDINLFSQIAPGHKDINNHQKY